MSSERAAAPLAGGGLPDHTTKRAKTGAMRTKAGVTRRLTRNRHCFCWPHDHLASKENSTFGSFLYVPVTLVGRAKDVRPGSPRFWLLSGFQGARPTARRRLNGNRILGAVHGYSVRQQRPRRPRHSWGFGIRGAFFGALDQHAPAANEAAARVVAGLRDLAACAKCDCTQVRPGLIE